MACENGIGAIGCRKYFDFTVPALRVVLYSLGAWLCWRIAAYGTSTLEDAALLRFPHDWTTDNSGLDGSPQVSQERRDDPERMQTPR
jgi:hypothetical protein